MPRKQGCSRGKVSFSVDERLFAFRPGNFRRNRPSFLIGSICFLWVSQITTFRNVAVLQGGRHFRPASSPFGGGLVAHQGRDISFCTVKLPVSDQFTVN